MAFQESGIPPISGSDRNEFVFPVTISFSADRRLSLFPASSLRRNPQSISCHHCHTLKIILLCSSRCPNGWTNVPWLSSAFRVCSFTDLLFTFADILILDLQFSTISIIFLLGLLRSVLTTAEFPNSFRGVRRMIRCSCPSGCQMEMRSLIGRSTWFRARNWC